MRSKKPPTVHPIISPVAYGATLILGLRWQAEGFEMPDNASRKGACVMDRFALASSLRAANARVVAGQWALLEQRNQVRELEQCGLDASTAKALLQIYEESQAMSIIDRNCLRHSLTRLATDRASPVDYDDRGLYDAEDAEDDDYLRQAA
jgi:hypothetical protein